MNNFSTELYHHGIKGQKWGVQNGPPYPLDYNDHTAAEKRAMKKDAKSIRNSLNRLDQDRAQLTADAIATRNKAANYVLKAAKAETKGKTSKTEEYLLKANDLSKVYKNLVEDLSENRKNTESFIKEAVSKGYVVKSSEITRDVNRGKNFVASLAATGVSAAVTVATGGSTGIGYNLHTVAPGLAYKVYVGDKNVK